MMLSTLEDRKLKSGDMVRARIGRKVYTAKVLDADDPAKLLVELGNGRTVWVGRRAVESVNNGD